MKRESFWWIVFVLSTLALCVYLSLTYWHYLHNSTESLSTAIRNVSLIIGGVIAVDLAVWRSVVGVRQVDTAQVGLLNERFQKGAEMLGSENLSVRLGGIYALKHLAADHPEQYHIQVMELLCAFVRHPTKDEALVVEPYEEEQSPRSDIRAIVELICRRSDSQIQVERKAGFSLDLSNADLCRLRFENADLSGANLNGAKLVKSSLAKANLSNAQFADAMFSLMRPSISPLAVKDYTDKVHSHANLIEANVSGASFSLPKGFHPAKGLLQARLNEACADPDNIPKVDGVKDGDTGSPIVWGGNACE